MFNPETFTFDLAAIMRRAHELARADRYPIYAVGLKFGLRTAWIEARGMRTGHVFRSMTAAQSPELKAVVREAFMIRMQDRMTCADFARVAELDAKAASLRAAA